MARTPRTLSVASAIDGPTTSTSLARAGAELVRSQNDPFVVLWPLALRAAHESGDEAATTSLLRMLDDLGHGDLTPLVRAERRLALARLVPEPVARVDAIEVAVSDLREAGSPYHLALGLLDLGAAQVEAGKDPGDVLSEAASIGFLLGSPDIIARAGG